MDTTGLIDNRNLKLWNSLRSVHEIEINQVSGEEYSAYSKDNKTIISVPACNLNAASFTHELLHIYLRTKDVFIGGVLTLSIKKSEKLSRIFSDALIDHISNSLDHIKMFPEFLKLGYPKSEFISDHSINKLTFEEVRLIRKYFKTTFLFRTTYKASAIDFFIGKYFAASACTNTTFDYPKQLAELKKIDNWLFEILETFIFEWKNYDYTNTDFSKGYYTIVFDFIEKLNEWADNKKIK
ncbi:hypothetical protein SDC9_21804 [bioreactor metagenome]|uniref:Uncharacterized protein n=1 Tax=bioreactor metagenome TaxID=1076179 RepID=A0A644UAE9_9ZZZZ|nr:hypothetical protein [Lentimicrobium sp.]MEA5111553.1 hypothetical protein [Lentimicrobium sp.]